MYILYLVLNAAQNSSCTYSLRFKMPSVLSCALYIHCRLVSQALLIRVMECLSGVCKVGGSTEKQH